MSVLTCDKVLVDAGYWAVDAGGTGVGHLQGTLSPGKAPGRSYGNPVEPLYSGMEK